MWKRSRTSWGALVGVCAWLVVGCMQESRDPVSLEPAPSRLDGARFTIVFDPATGELLLIRGGQPNALQVIPEGTEADQAQIRVLGVQRNADCGFSDSFCLDVELVSYFLSEQLSDAQVVLTSLSGNSFVLNSDLIGLGGWLYGEVAPADACVANSAALRRWIFGTSAGGRVSFTGEIRAQVGPLAAADCTGGSCDTCEACSCTQACVGEASCDAACTDGATCTVDVSNANNTRMLCADSTCDFSCASVNNCDAVCEGESSCTTECGQLNNCDTVCTDNASCVGSCVSANNCDYFCDATSSCETFCEDFNNCKTVCEDEASCTQTCTTRANCDLDCKDDAQCLLQCPEGSKKCSLSCSGTLLECGGGLFACNRPCP